MGRKIFPCCFAWARFFRISAGRIKGSKWSFWLEIISSETGLNVQRPTCKQRNCIQTFFSFNFSISSGVKWSEAVGAAAEPISCAKKVWYHCSFSFSYLIYGGRGIWAYFSRKDKSCSQWILNLIPFSVNSWLSKKIVSEIWTLLPGLKFLLSETRHSKVFSESSW